MARKFKQFYTDEKVVKGNYVDNPDHNLFSDGIYRTKLTEKDLPDSFVKWTSWYNRFVDMLGVVDVYYKVSGIADTTMKYDNFFISYNKKIQLEENGYAIEGTYDYIISGVWGNEVIDKLEKYSFMSPEKIAVIKEAYNKRVEEVSSNKENEMKEMGFIKSDNGIGWTRIEEK